MMGFCAHTQSTCRYLHQMIATGHHNIAMILCSEHLLVPREDSNLHGGAYLAAAFIQI